MSFYGQVLYEFTKLFTKINVSNNTTETATAVTSGSQPSLVAADRWDQFDLKGGNRWIHLNSNNQNKTITISHSTPGAVDNNRTVVGFKPLTTDEVAQLPTEVQESIIQLNAQQCIQTTKSQYDAAGHSVDAETSYFYLPVSDTKLQLDEIEERVDNIENKHLTISSDDQTEYIIDSTNKGISIEDYLNTNNYLTEDILGTTMGEYLKDNNYITTEFTGEKTVIYPNRKQDDNFPTLAETIGPLDNSENGVSKKLNALLYGEDVYMTTVYSISETLNHLIAKITKLEEVTQKQDNSYYGLLVAVGALDQRVKALEEKLTPTE